MTELATRAAFTDDEGIDYFPDGKKLLARTLKDADMQDLHRKLRGIEDHELEVQRAARKEMFLDQQYYDHEQFSSDERRILEQRGQAPIVYNWCKPRADWLSGTERRARIDFAVAPRVEDPAARATALAKTKLMKYVSDANRAPHAYSSAFKQAGISGLSWVECGIRKDSEDEPIYIRHENWWSCLHDSSAQEMGLTDRRYHFRIRPTDIDVAAAMFPGEEGHFKRMTRTGTGFRHSDQMEWYMGKRFQEWVDEYDLIGDYGTTYRTFTRPQIDLRECWIYLPVKETIKDPGSSSTYDRIKMRLVLVIYDDEKILSHSISPYRHNKIPFTPVWCYRKMDGSFYGVIRGMRDAQDSYNKRMAKALFAISSRTTIMEAGAIDESVMTADQLREEASRPDAQLILADGAVSQNRIRIESGQALAEASVRMAELDLRFLDVGTGINSENLGNETNASSGVAIEKRQSEGSITTTEPFDNLHFSRSEIGRQQVSLIEEFYVAPKTIRLTGDQVGSSEYAEINTSPENDITRFEADFVLDQQAYRGSIAQAAMDQLMALMQQLAPVDPMIVRALVDVWASYSNVPNKEQVLERIRSITGQRDKTKPETPEEQQAREMRDREMAERNENDKRRALAETEQAVQKAEKLKADVGKVQAQSMQTVGNLLREAIEAANMLLMTASAAPVADALVQEATTTVMGDGSPPGVPDAPPGAMPPGPMQPAQQMAQPQPPVPPGLPQ